MNASPAKYAFTFLTSLTRHMRLLASAFLAMWLGVSIPTTLRGGQAHSSDPNLTAHEWGTFTSVAGADGRAVEWLPISTATDLPGFVEHYSSANLKVSLRGTVRMETPVIYFYTPRETKLSVHVSFSKGLITEWYPHADGIRPASQLSDVALYQSHADGSVAWNSVTLAPNLAPDFPREHAASHYYAARETSAVPVSVKTSSGDQRERFLFYRGISAISLPLSAQVLPDGKIQIENLGAQAIPALVLFERRGDKLGYRIVPSLQDRVALETPAVSGTLDSLRSDLEDILAAQGLYRDEARAMVETWRDSWFEEGSRLFYIVPRPFVDSVLPLSIHPAPAQLTRVFVGRLELVTPVTEKSVETALASRDRETLRKYSRFLEPILDIMIARQPDPARASRLREALAASYGSLFAQSR